MGACVAHIPITAIVTMEAVGKGTRYVFTALHRNEADPKRLLKGSGNQARFIRVPSAREVRHPDLEALMAAAIRRASVPPGGPAMA